MEACFKAQALRFPIRAQVRDHFRSSEVRQDSKPFSAPSPSPTFSLSLANPLQEQQQRVLHMTNPCSRACCAAICLICLCLRPVFLEDSSCISLHYKDLSILRDHEVNTVQVFEDFLLFVFVRKDAQWQKNMRPHTLACVDKPSSTQSGTGSSGSFGSAAKLSRPSSREQIMKEFGFNHAKSSSLTVGTLLSWVRART